MKLLTILIMKKIQMKVVIIQNFIMIINQKLLIIIIKNIKKYLKFCGGRIDAVQTYVDLNDSNWKLQYKEKIGEKIMIL